MKKILVLFFTVVMLLTLGTITAFAAEETEETADAIQITGAGTEGDPYVIEDVEDLKYFRDSVNAGETTYNGNGVYIKLANDIDLNNEQWEPIGSTAFPFKGNFNGNNCTIYNLTCLLDVETTQRAGLFAEISNATIGYLNVHNVNCSALARVAAIAAGNATGSVITNCKVTGDINLKGYQYIGGIVGRINNTRIIDCAVEGTADNYAMFTTPEADGYGKMYVGGIAGWLEAGNYGISGCSVKYIDITTQSNTGAIIGLISAGTIIENCTISNVNITADSKVYRPYNVGVIAGGCNTTAKNPATLNGIVVENANVTDGGVTVTAPYGNCYDGSGATGHTNIKAYIGYTYYSSFEEALADANANASSETQYLGLLADVTVDETIAITGTGGHVVFDLNGCDIVSNAQTAIKATGNFGIINRGGQESSITTTVEGGTVINVTSSGLFSAFVQDKTFVIGDGTGTALKSEAAFCTISGGTYLGDVSIAVSMFTRVTGGTYSEDPSAFVSTGYLAEQNSDGLYAVEAMIKLTQVFTYKGYSLNEEGTGVVATYTINHQNLDTYEKQNGVTVDFGAVFAINAIDGNEVVHSLATYEDTTTYNIKINEISADGYGTVLIMAMYIDLGQGKQYVTSDENNATVFVDSASVPTITYSQASASTTKEEE